MLASRQEQVKNLAKVRTFIAEDSGKVVHDVLFFQVELVFLDIAHGLLMHDILKLLWVFDSILEAHETPESMQDKSVLFVRERCSPRAQLTVFEPAVRWNEAVAW